MPTVAFYTLGCKVNAYDTQLINSGLRNMGWEVVPFHSDPPADVFIINTCTVTAKADAKSRYAIRKAAANPDSKIVATGCYTRSGYDALSSIDGLNLIISDPSPTKILDYLKDIKPDDPVHIVVEDYSKGMEYEEDGVITDFDGYTRAFVKVNNGCNAKCSYCIIPRVRGPLRSRRLDTILDEVRQLADKGFQEIVLAGIRLGKFGRENGGTDVSLIDVVRGISDIPDIKRIRFSSIEATDITEDMLKALSECEKFCPHLHLPLQSGDDEVLTRMRRWYRMKDYMETIENAVKIFPDMAFTGDVMVGFPGETEENFTNTLKTISEVGYFKIHVFRFSPREGTPAADFPDHVSEEVKTDRSNRLRTAGDQSALRFSRRFLDKPIEVLWEQIDEENGTITGHTRNYITVSTEADPQLLNHITFPVPKAQESPYILSC